MYKNLGQIRIESFGKIFIIKKEGIEAQFLPYSWESINFAAYKILATIEETENIIEFLQEIGELKNDVIPRPKKLTTSHSPINTKRIGISNRTQQ